MPKQAAKGIILSALQFDPDFSRLGTLSDLSDGESRTLLAWLDRSGLALSFLRQLQTHGVTQVLLSDFREALELRLEKNRLRLRDMLEEFQRINEALISRGIRACTLKGFSLVPDFCEDPSLRHQTDFDFLVAPEHVEAVAETLRTFGYSTAHLSQSEESCFMTPALHIPTQRDDIYAIQQQRQLDLHTCIVENSPWLAFEVPRNCLANSESMTIQGVPFFGLSLEDRFLLQVLHVYRHSSRSWIRLSWLLEIARFLAVHCDNQELWSRITVRAGQSTSTKRIFAFVLGLTQRLFRGTVPRSLNAWSSAAVTGPLLAWLDHFSVPWATCDWPGSLTNILLAPEFILDRKLRRQYLRSRLLPRKTQQFLGTSERAARRISFQFRVEQLRYALGRCLAHGGAILGLPLQQLRWKRALNLARTAAPESHLESPLGHGEVS